MPLDYGPNCRMRHRDPHDDPPAKRRPSAYRGPPVTPGDIRAHGVRRLLIYCSRGLYCHHSATVDADRWPDETAVRDLRDGVTKDQRVMATKPAANREQVYAFANGAIAAGTQRREPPP
jgi:hypothetical protein